MPVRDRRRSRRDAAGRGPRRPLRRRRGRGSIGPVALLTSALAATNGPGALAEGLHEAIHAGDRTAVERALAAGADVNEEREGWGTTPLEQALGDGRLEIAKLLLRAGADPDRQDRMGTSLLMSAILSGGEDHAAARVLIEGGADLELTDRKDRTALDRAWERGDLAAVRLLVEAGADVDRLRDGGVLLHDVAAAGETELVRFLLEHEADPDPVSALGATPLGTAVTKGDAELVQLLLDAGADPERELLGGISLVQMARLQQRSDIVALLEGAASQRSAERSARSSTAAGDSSGGGDSAAQLREFMEDWARRKREQEEARKEDRPPAPAVTGEGRYPAGPFGGPCDFEQTSPTSGRIVVTGYYPGHVREQDLRDHPLVGRLGDAPTIVDLISASSAFGGQGLVSPPACEPVELTAGPYTKVVHDIRAGGDGGSVERSWTRFQVGGEVRRPRPVGERPEEPLRAVAGGPYSTSRGTRLLLDGSRSQGEIESYRWSFAPGPDCPAGGPFHPQAQKVGATADVVLLCSTQITLTVSDGEKSDAVGVLARVLPRPWETPAGHEGPEGRLPTSSRSSGTTSILALPTGAGWTLPDVSFGRNVSVHGDREELNLLFDPLRQAGSWRGRGYEIERVEDQGGPFHGAFYVTRYEIEMRRRTLINPYIPSDGVPPLRGMATFYAYNAQNGHMADLDVLLRAARKHEEEHTRLMMQALARKGDPGPEIEAWLDADAAALQGRVDRRLREVEKAACLATISLHANPLPEERRPLLLFWPRTDALGWVELTLPGIRPEGAAAQQRSAATCRK